MLYRSLQRGDRREWSRNRNGTHSVVAAMMLLDDNASAKALGDAFFGSLGFGSQP